MESFESCANDGNEAWYPSCPVGCRFEATGWDVGLAGARVSEYPNLISVTQRYIRSNKKSRQKDLTTSFDVE